MQQLLDPLVEYWELVLLTVTWAGIALVWWRSRSDWRRKRFIQQVNFSLNIVEDGVLQLRTLLECSSLHVWLNEYGVRQVVKAANNTEVGQPFLRLRSSRDMGYVKRAVVNVLSERFADAFVARAVGADVRTARFVFGITWERYGNIRTHKLRVIVIEADQLAQWFGLDADASSLEVATERHRDRITTLQRMHTLLHSRRERDRRMIGHLELGTAVARPRAAETWWADRPLPRDELEAQEDELEPPDDESVPPV